MSQLIEVLAAAGEAGVVDTRALEPDARAAIASGDRAAIGRLLGLTRTYACMVVAPENEPEPVAPADQPEEDEPQPDADAA